LFNNVEFAVFFSVLLFFLMNKKHYNMHTIKKNRTNSALNSLINLILAFKFKSI